MTRIDEEYVRQSAGSREHFLRAQKYLPAGASRSLNSWKPHPIYLTRGCGAAVRDLDGRWYADWLNNYTALILGHAHQAVVSAVTERLDDGTCFAFSTELECELAQLLVERIPSVERVRFTSSGSEAAMFALRLARAHTGRERIAKMEGGFHGTYDDVLVCVRTAATAGRSTAPDSAGLRPRLDDDVLVLPFNDAETTMSLLEEHGDDLAAIIVEPVLGVGGMIPPLPGYLEMLREQCTHRGIVFIFDEVITLRLAPGGAQQRTDVTPDLTVMGKVIGGGLPVGAFGGGVDLMELLEPCGGHDVYDARSGGPPLYQGGTFTGNPLTLAAGIATLNQLTPTVYQQLNDRGDELRARLAEVFEEMGTPACVTGVGSLFHIHLTRGPVRSWSDGRRGDGVLQQQFFLGMLNRGIVIAPRGMGCVSAAITEEHVDQFVRAAHGVLTDVMT